MVALQSAAAPPVCGGTSTGSTATTLTAPADGSFYVHVCAVDLAGNASSVAVGGPYVVDTAGPAGLVVSSSSHTVSTWSNDNTVDFGWSGATDQAAVSPATRSRIDQSSAHRTDLRDDADSFYLYWQQFAGRRQLVDPRAGYRRRRQLRQRAATSVRSRSTPRVPRRRPGSPARATTSASPRTTTRSTSSGRRRSTRPGFRGSTVTASSSRPARTTTAMR